MNRHCLIRPFSGVVLLLACLAGCVDEPSPFPLCRESAKSLAADLRTIEAWDGTEGSGALYLRLNAPPVAATYQTYLFCLGHDGTDAQADAFSRASANAYAWFGAASEARPDRSSLTEAYTTMHKHMKAASMKSN